MTYIIAVKSGLWSDPTVWNVGYVPGIYECPIIPAPYTVTIAFTIQTRGFYISGGFIYQAALIIITDCPNCGIWIDAINSGGFSSNGHTFAPQMIISATAGIPTYQWRFFVDPIIGKDNRTLNFDFLEMTGNFWYVGNTHYPVWFNQYYMGSSSSWIESVTPLSKDPINIEHPIDGRSASRIYQRGSHAGTVTVTGFVPWETHDYDLLRLLQESRERFAFFSKSVHLPRCRFDSKPKFSAPPGSMIVPFSLTLIEDV